MTLDFYYVLMFCAAAAAAIISGLLPEPYSRIKKVGWLAGYLVAGYLVWDKGIDKWHDYIGPWLFMAVFSGIVYYLYQKSCISRGSKVVSVISIQKIIDCLYLWPVLLPEAVDFWIKENEKDKILRQYRERK